jgi:nitrogen PTS system EIIA component
LNVWPKSCILKLFFPKNESVLCAMQLTVRDASKLLNLEEKEIYRLIKKSEIPFYRLNKSCFFNRAELFEWAIARSVDISADFFSSPDSQTNQMPQLADAIRKGGVHSLTNNDSKSDVLRAVVSLIPGIVDADKERILVALLARETLGSTAIGNGIAIPHVRNPIIINSNDPLILLCFLSTPIDYGALDGKKVSTIFTMISPNTRIHLHLLARLSFILQNHDVQTMLGDHNNNEAMLLKIRALENAIPAASSPGAVR